MGQEMNQGGEKGRKRTTEGKTLAELLEREGPFSPARVFAWMEPAVRQLAREHGEGRVHGGITPACIIIYHQLWYCFPLSDERRKNFSIWEKGQEKGQLTAGRRQNTQGADADRSQGWKALEEKMEQKETGPWSDVYSLCAVMYAAITGRPPENAADRMSGAELRPPSQLGIQIDETQEAALMKGLALLRKDRWQDGGELYRALYADSVSENTEAGVQPLRKAGSETEERKPAVKHGKTGLIISAGILAAAVLLVLLIRGISGSRPAEGGHTYTASAVHNGTVQEEEPSEIESQETETGTEEVQTESETAGNQKNMLMADSAEYVDDKSVILGTDIPCESVITVTFLDSLADRPEEYWDVSAAGDGSVAAWAEENGEGYDLYIGAEGRVTANPDCSDLFANCVNLRKIDFQDHFDTSQAVDMNSMFYDCISLAELDVSSFDTSQVTDMRWMFYNCEGLEELDAGSFHTGRVTSMQSMFAGCRRLVNLNVSSFDTSQVTVMSNMFKGCEVLNGLDVSNFDTSQVTTMHDMFSMCNGLTELDISGFDTSQVKNISWMFYNCFRLTALDVSGFDTSQVTDMSYMFYGCQNLEQVDVSGFDTSRVTDFRSMFENCRDLAELDISGFDMSSMEFDDDMLAGTRWE